METNAQTTLVIKKMEHAGTNRLSATMKIIAHRTNAMQILEFVITLRNRATIIMLAQ
jgi:hypothetical protein